ncbi:hypothetical protein SARC_12187 [Sphaeroforma arctica JP610]|uniref:EGF-like domain-containing protein n=1 Tax=Sphaeroforma arctica JP610 TaxID=667725 RepID=A0A0L0FFM6_9EUKA|nr:hypothetical protein SARC_12187 [Sphaeroforma arctica JP610]KNC75286.1 hypothetical protein SARC_12187 [Sphaeroforma arctica JP610]|eukprot:XP_014149188.1 hypothetical protein SARC_12187 [Sphaeroforma arctica JP610]
MVDGDYTLYNQSTLDGRQNVRSFLVNLTALIEVDEKSIQVMQIEPGVGMQLSLGTWSAGEIDRRLIANDVNITELGVLQSKRVLYDNDTARVLNGNSDVADMVTRLCDPNPCGKNGKCKIDTELYEWECACKAPWTGDLCDITLKLEVLEPFTTFDPVKFQKVCC